MATRAIALILTLGLTLPGCAPATRPPLQGTPAVKAAEPNRTLLADYVQKLPVGSRVRVHLADGRRERGTLMDATADRIVIQPRTRIPEPPVQLPLDGVVAVELEHANGGVGRAIGIGIAAGAGAIVGVMLLLAAVYSD